MYMIRCNPLHAGIAVLYFLCNDAGTEVKANLSSKSCLCIASTWFIWLVIISLSPLGNIVNLSFCPFPLKIIPIVLNM